MGNRYIYSYVAKFDLFLTNLGGKNLKGTVVGETSMLF